MPKLKRFWHYNGILIAYLWRTNGRGYSPFMTGSTLKPMSRVNTYRKENICYSAGDISDGQELNMFLTNNRERNNKQDILAYS